MINTSLLALNSIKLSIDDFLCHLSHVYLNVILIINFARQLTPPECLTLRPPEPRVDALIPRPDVDKRMHPSLQPHCNQYVDLFIVWEALHNSFAPQASHLRGSLLPYPSIPPTKESAKHSRRRNRGKESAIIAKRAWKKANRRYRVCMCESRMTSENDCTVFVSWRAVPPPPRARFI